MAQPPDRTVEAEHPLAVAVRLHERVLDGIGRHLGVAGDEREGAHERRELGPEEPLELLVLVGSPPMQQPH